MVVSFRQILLSVIFLGPGALSCMAQSLAHDSEMPPDPYEVFILLDNVQKEMLGSDAGSTIDWAEYGPLGGFLGPAGMFVGSSIDGITTLARRDSDAATAAGLQGAGRTFNFEVAVKGLVNQLDFDSNWLLYDMEQGDFAGAVGNTARRIFHAPSVDYVLAVNPSYFISPELNQVRARFVIRFYSRSKVSDRIRPTYERSYEYVSPSRGEILRPFRAGEKEALIEEIEIQFNTQLERYPRNKKAYEKERASALALLRNRDVILPSRAVQEGWPEGSLNDELLKATAQMTRMLQLDLADIRPVKKKPGKYVSFSGLNRSGKLEEFRGYVVAKQGENTIYRVRNGDIYSVP